MAVAMWAVGVHAADMFARDLSRFESQQRCWAVPLGHLAGGGIAVPLPLGSPATELEYFLDDAQPVTVVSMRMDKKPCECAHQA